MKYKIRSGDTLGTIAKKLLGSAAKYKDIAKANNISDPNKIRVGQVLTIPTLKGDVHSTKKPLGKPTVAAPKKKQIYTKTALKAILSRPTDAKINKYLGALNTVAEQFKINTPLRAAHFIAQLAHESGSFKHTTENLNYGAPALRSVFGKYFKTEAQAQQYARKPQKIASRVYADRMGNGNEKSGEGWKYRGRGLIQLTGKDNYTKCGAALGRDLVANPDPVATNANLAVGAAAWYWNSRRINALADKDDVRAVTKRINGGYNGLDDRKKYLAKAKKALRV